MVVGVFGFLSPVMSIMPIIKEKSEGSSSSDDEIMKEALKEATDTHFFRKSLFNNKETKCEQELSNTKYNHVEKYDEFGVSEGFKDFVAKKLTKLLDRNIEMSAKTTSSKHSRKRKKNDHEESDCGIRLLRASGNFLTSVDINTSSNQQTYKPRKKSVEIITSKDNNLKCKEAAVDPQWILSKVETTFWSKKQKGTVYEYKKLPDGTLIEK